MSDLPLPAGSAPRRPSFMNRIVASSLQQRLLVILLTLVLIAAGVHSLQRLPVDAYPDLSPPLVEVITQWPGRTAEEVERLITVPIEKEMNGIPRLTTIRSISLYGLSDVILTYENGTDNYFARQEVFNRLPDVSLPSTVSPSVAPLSAPSGLIYRYVLQSPDRSPMELNTFEDGTPVLVKDVGRVALGIAPRIGEFGYQKQDDAVEGVILLRTGEKTQDVL